MLVRMSLRHRGREGEGEGEGERENDRRMTGKLGVGGRRTREGGRRRGGLSETDSFCAFTCEGEGEREEDERERGSICGRPGWLETHTLCISWHVHCLLPPWGPAGRRQCRGGDGRVEREGESERIFVCERPLERAA